MNDKFEYIKRAEKRKNKKLILYRGIRKNFCFILIGIIAVGFSLNYSSTAKYIQRFEPAIQSITAATWEVDLSIEHNGQGVNEQILNNFKPGDVKTNFIKFINKNEYNTTFILEVNTKGSDESNNIFLNSNIELILKRNNELGLSNIDSNQWQDVQGEQGEKSYKYKIDIPANTTLCYQMDIVWNSSEEDVNYAGKEGKVEYRVIAEQLIISEGELITIE